MKKHIAIFTTITLRAHALILLAILVIVTGLTGCGSRYGEPVSGKVEPDITVSLSIQPEKPRAGENKFKVLLKDPNGPIQNANVRVEYFMPAMGTMPVMQSGSAGTPSSPGEYIATLKLPMEGTWTITVQAEIPGKGKVAAVYGIRTGSQTVTFEGG